MKDYILEIKKLIPDSICKKIILYHGNGFEEAKVTSDKTDGSVIKNLRSCQIKNIQIPSSFGEMITLNYIKSKIHTAVESYKNSGQIKYHQFYVKGISQLDILKYEANSYDAGYKYHVDMGPQTTPRQLSLSICLNNDYEGGEFKFKLGGEEYQYPQNIGDCIIFPSNFMFPHQVNRITKGTRFALIGWAC